MSFALSLSLSLSPINPSTNESIAALLGTSSLCLAEFVAVMSRKVNATYTADEVKQAFRVFEGSAPPGHIRLDVLERALTTYGADKLSHEQAAELVHQIEADPHTGLFNYADYVSMMMED